MQDLKTIAMRIEESKEQRKALKETIADILSQSADYIGLAEARKETTERMKQLQNTLLADHQDTVEELAKLNESIAADSQVLADIALTMLMRGEPAVFENLNFRYEAQVKVSVKQMRLL